MSSGNDSPSQPNADPQRRPIRSRDTFWARSITNALVRTGISPNAISLAGMLAAIAAGCAFAATSNATEFTHRALWLSGALLCQLRLLCNLFDGMVAIARGIASPTGELYNEVPDRISDAAIFIGLGYAATSQPELGYLAALTSVFVAYVRATGRSLGAGNDFCGPMAKPQRMALVTLLGIYLAFAPDAWRSSHGEARIILAAIIAGNLMTAARRLKHAGSRLRESAR
jgi:phosphatidylglycerophosphate synthase